MKMTWNWQKAFGLRMVALAMVAGGLTTGCKTYQQQNKVVVYWQQGDLTHAVQEARAKAKSNANNKDAIIWELEKGAVLRTAGLYEESNEAFDTAQEKIDRFALRAKVRVGQEAGALLSNQAQLDYEGRAYDGIMLNTYKALNYLTLNQPDKARPEMVRAYQRQQDAVEANKKRIEEAQAAAAKDKNSQTIAKAQNDNKFQAQIAKVSDGLDGIRTYADYVNPFTVYLDGLYFMANSADNSDLERARKSLERASQMAPKNQYLKEDLAQVTNALPGQPLPAVTYVVFETGCAPVRDQIRIDVPIIISKVSYVGAAIPTLKPQGQYIPNLTVEASGARLNTELVASIDAVVAKDFKNELPVIITKTVAATVVKAVAAYAVNDSAQNAGGNLGGLLAQIGTAVYEMAVNIADERTWTTLPKEIQVARLPTPADRKIELTTPNGMKSSVVVGEGTLNVVYVKSISNSTPLLVSQFKLK